MKRLKRLGYLFLPLPLAAAAPSEEKFVGIGYTNCAAAAAAAGPPGEKARELKWYFAHASVGANMMEGMMELHGKDPQLYPIESVASGGTAPAETRPGVIYEHNRGNPEWKTKFNLFEDSVSSGWRYPKINVAMNKLCYIDQAASFKYYLHSMTNLEAQFPETVFVYMTIPLMTSTDGDNFLRNAFNDRLREWARQHGRVLFDIADIESHDATGVPCTFKYRQRTCQRLCDAYTTDGGHLNPVGRQLVARGLYALAMALDERKRAVP